MPPLAIVAGSGRDFYDELEAAQHLHPDADIIAVNFAACFIAAPVPHLVSLHHDEVGAFRNCRRALHWCSPYPAPLTHSVRPWNGVDRVWREWDSEEGRQGTSSLLAVRVALALGYGRVILAGVPLDGRGGFYDPPGVTPGAYDAPTIRGHWAEAAATWFQGRVTSLGGWTEELLGAPL